MQRLARLLVFGGTVVTVVVLARIHAANNDYSYTGTFRFGWTLAYIGLLTLSAYSFGLPDLVRGRSAVLSIVGAVGSAAIAISLLQLIAGSALLPRFVVFGSALVLLVWYGLCVTLALSRSGTVRDRVLLVCDQDDVEAVRADLERAPEKPAVVVATLAPDNAGVRKPSARVIARTATDADANLLVLSQRAQADDAIVAQAAELHEAGMRVRSLTNFCAEWLGKLPISELERTSLMFDIRDVHIETYARFKRIFDVVVAVAGLLALVVLLPLVVIGDIVANRGPLLFRQPRVGRQGREFEIVKLRTMRPDAGNANTAPGAWTTDDDPRVTPFGRVLRRTHLDELPQVINVLRGDLSIIGPRPEQPRYVAELTEKIPFYEFRHLVRPGLTGWAQVKYPYGSNEGDALEKLQYEFFYLRYQGPALDLRVVRRTLGQVVGLGGR